MQPKLNTFLLALIAFSFVVIAISLAWMAVERSKQRYQPLLQPSGDNNVIIVDTKTGKTYLYRAEKKKLEAVSAYDTYNY